jgi:hypothetical protein
MGCGGTVHWLCVLAVSVCAVLIATLCGCVGISYATAEVVWVRGGTGMMPNTGREVGGTCSVPDAAAAAASVSWLRPAGNEYERLAAHCRFSVGGFWVCVECGGSSRAQAV